MHLVGGQVDMVAVEDLGHDAPLRGHTPAASAQSFQQVTHEGQPNRRRDQVPNGCDFGSPLDLDNVHCRIETGFGQGTGLAADEGAATAAPVEPVLAPGQEAHVTSQGPLTTEAGAPVADNQNSETAGVGGPVLVQDQALLEKLAHFNRERIPERIVHARGAGAYGTFTLTRDVSQWTRAKFLSEVGKQTETFLRFSTVAGSLGSADAVRDPAASR